jgi:hypothetical protein
MAMATSSNLEQKSKSEKPEAKIKKPEEGGGSRFLVA